MGYQWEDVKAVIERIEEENVIDELTQLEAREGFIDGRVTITERAEGYLRFLGALALGVNIGLIAVILCYILLVTLLHIEF
jgi:hypothetical protein